jgi:hypothetical protein
MKNDKIITDTISRNANKRPIDQIKPFVRKIERNMDIARNKSITHFTPAQKAITAKPNSAEKQLDVGPVKHLLATKVDKRRLLSNNIIPQLPISKNSKSIKEQMIAETFSKLAAGQQAEKEALKRKSKIVNIFAIVIGLLIIIGFFVYINLPSISVDIASSQSGIKATYPEYRPDGYSLSGPATYDNGKVTMRFRNDDDSQEFTITETKSSWDSSAVKDKVNKDSKGLFITTEENGLTIYTYNGNAAWVNGGILYTITSNALLSNSQIRHIVTSL